MRFEACVSQLRHDRAMCDEAVAEGGDAHIEGFVKLLVSAGGELLGATIVSANAGDEIAEVTLAMQNGLALADVARTLHPYPT